MKLVLALVVLCLAGVTSAKSVQNLKTELLQTIREIIGKPPQDEENTVDPMPPYSEEEEGTPDDNTVDPMPPYSEEEEEEGGTPEDNTVDPMPPYSEEEEEEGGGTPDDNTVDPMPPYSEEEEEEEEGTPEDNTVDPMPPYSEEEEEEGTPEDNTMEPMPDFLEEENPQAAAETLQADWEVKMKKARNVADFLSVRSVHSVAPSPDDCSNDNKYRHIRKLEEQVANLTASIQILAERTTAAVDIQSTMLQIQHLADRLDALRAFREQLLTDKFTAIRDEIIALAALLPQLEQNREDAELLQLYQNQLDNLTGILAELSNQGVSVLDLQRQVLQLKQQLQDCQQGLPLPMSTTTPPPPTTTPSPPELEGFKQQQTVAGRTVTCSSANIEYIDGFTAFTCHDIKVNGVRFPNGVNCHTQNSDWHERNSGYTDHVGFCNRILDPTGQRQATKIQVFYLCDAAQPRAVWRNGAWAADFRDNGYTRSLRCMV
ncbi:OLFM3 [Branchiostoma lanceolatum]|uniref:OLFM3 protein n=1 Tax=Branchiostoma lanceolatum TaxID=7740 RepID=A0A8J9YNF3_BRALA|nr:OLFM3 [Branchiostoma lanceolatum]